MIRRADPADADAIAGLTAHTDPRADASGPDLAAMMTVPGRVDLVALAGATLAGWSFAEPDGAATAQVAPAHRGAGLGTELLAAAAAAAGATDLTIEVRDDAPEGLAFLDRRGFREVARELEVALDLAAITLAPPAMRGITFATRAQRPGLEEAMYRVAVEAEPDIPADQPTGPGPFPEWRALNLDRPARRPELTFLALAAGRVVGFAILHAGPAETCYHGLTAVARDWRGRGIARALKERQIEAAQAAGYRWLVTENEVRNAPIRHLNDALGYRERGATLFMAGAAAAIRRRA